MTPSGGVHVTLPDYYSPENMGLIVPKTKDGRVVFMLPWQVRILRLYVAYTEKWARTQATEEVMYLLC